MSDTESVDLAAGSSPKSAGAKERKALHDSKNRAVKTLRRDSLAYLDRAVQRAKKYSGKKGKGKKGKGKTRRRKARHNKFCTYIHRVLRKAVSGKVGISSKAMCAVDSLLQDVLVRAIEHAGALAKYSSRKTLLQEDVATAVKLITKDAAFARSVETAGKAAVDNYNKS